MFIFNNTIIHFINYIIIPSNLQLILQVPIDFSIKDILKSKSIVEFPTVFIGKHENTINLHRTIMILPTDHDDCSPDNKKQKLT